jgi:hypothetical protein
MRLYHAVYDFAGNNNAPIVETFTSKTAALAQIAARWKDHQQDEAGLPDPIEDGSKALFMLDEETWIWLCYSELNND